jgi:hypothetical protein
MSELIQRNTITRRTVLKDGRIRESRSISHRNSVYNSKPATATDIANFKRAWNNLPFN